MGWAEDALAHWGERLTALGETLAARSDHQPPAPAGKPRSMGPGPTTITRKPHGGYRVETPLGSEPPLSYLVRTGYTFTLWGARRLARKHRRWIAERNERTAYREVIQ